MSEENKNTQARNNIALDFVKCWGMTFEYDKNGKMSLMDTQDVIDRAFLMTDNLLKELEKSGD